MTVRYDRLEKLEKHLRSGKLGHKKFYFGVFNSNMTSWHEEDDDCDTKTNGCATMGCAIGELAIIDAKNWKFDGDSVLFRKNSSDEPSEDAAKYFGLDSDEIQHLFYPDSQYTDVYGGKNLESNATKKEVADNIKTFIKIKKLKEEFQKVKDKFDAQANKLGIYLEDE